MTKFPEKLKELRKERNMSRQELADIIYVSIRTISYWELGQRECNLEQLINLSKNHIVDIIKGQGAKSVKHVGVMTIDGNGKVYFQKNGKKYTTFNIRLPEGTKW